MYVDDLASKWTDFPIIIMSYITLVDYKKKYYSKPPFRPETEMCYRRKKNLILATLDQDWRCKYKIRFGQVK